MFIGGFTNNIFMVKFTKGTNPIFFFFFSCRAFIFQPIFSLWFLLKFSLLNMPTYFVCSYFVQDVRGVKMVATPNILYFYFNSKDKNPYEISYLQFANRFDLSLIVSERNINRDTNFKSKLYAVFPLNSFKKVNNQLFLYLLLFHI